MKNALKLLMGALIVAFSVSVATAQVRDSSSSKMNSSTKVTKSSTMSSSSTQSEEYVTMKGGVVMLHQNGKSSTLTNTYKASNGTSVATDGTVTKSDGKTVKLKEGDKVYKDGHMGWAAKKGSDSKMK